MVSTDPIYHSELWKNPKLWQTWKFWRSFKGRYIFKLTRTWALKVWSTKLKQSDICERNEKKLKGKPIMVASTPLAHWFRASIFTKTFSLDTWLIHRHKFWLPFKLKRICSKEEKGNCYHCKVMFSWTQSNKEYYSVNASTWNFVVGWIN